MVNIKVGVFEMVEQARAEIEEVETNDAIEQSKDQDCLVIDIRDVPRSHTIWAGSGRRWPSPHWS